MNYEMSLGNAIVASVVGPLVAVIVALALTSKLGAVGLVITVVGIALIYLERRR